MLAYRFAALSDRVLKSCPRGVGASLVARGPWGDVPGVTAHVGMNPLAGVPASRKRSNATLPANYTSPATPLVALWTVPATNTDERYAPALPYADGSCGLAAFARAPHRRWLLA